MIRHPRLELIVSLFLIVLAGCQGGGRGGSADGGPLEFAPGGKIPFEGSTSYVDSGGGVGPGGVPAGASPEVIGGSFSQLADSLKSAKETLQSAQSLSDPQATVFDRVVNGLDATSKFYRLLPINASPGATLDWLSRRAQRYQELERLAQEAREANLKWLADALYELSQRVDVLRFFNPEKLRSAFVAKPNDVRTFLNEASANGYYFTGIALQVWKTKVEVGGLRADRPVYQCYAAALGLFFPFWDAGCAGGQNLGDLGFLSAEKSAKAPTAIRWLFSYLIKDVIVSRSQEEIAALKTVGYDDYGALGYGI